MILNIFYSLEEKNANLFLFVSSPGPGQKSLLHRGWHRALWLALLRASTGLNAWVCTRALEFCSEPLNVLRACSENKWPCNFHLSYVFGMVFNKYSCHLVCCCLQHTFLSPWKPWCCHLFFVICLGISCCHSSKEPILYYSTVLLFTLWNPSFPRTPKHL